MTDEPRQDGQETPTGDTAVMTPPEEATSEPTKLRQEVEIKDAGPCRKHIKVTVDRGDIDARMSEHFSKLVMDSAVTGFRPGKAPRRLIEKRFSREVSEQVKSEVLLASLEQLGKDHDVAPLAPPNLELDKIEIPPAGPLVYEFEVEVRPEFDLPSYKGLKLKRPVKEITPDDVTEARRRVLGPYGQIVPKEGEADVGDIVVADVTVKDGETVIGTIQESNFRVERTLAFKDGMARKFADQIKGAKPGDTRTVDIELSSQAASGLGGKKVQGIFEIKDLKTVRLPDLDESFFQSNALGVANLGQLDEMIRATLVRNLEHTQRRAARMQVLDQINAASTWELPQDLLMRQARKAMQRRIMEMRADGLPDDQIEQQIRVMQQDILSSTAMALKEHFVLQKIAEQEKIDANEDDINDEIYRIADQTGESPRKVRARIEKEDMMDALVAEMIERKALDLILDSAEYEDVPMEPTEEESSMATVESQAVPGEMVDPNAAPPSENAPQS
jgi:trigger factor